MIRPRHLIALVMLCVTLALADWRTATLGAFAWLGIETATSSGERWAKRGATPLSAYTGKPIDAPLARTAVATVTGSHSGCANLPSRPQPCPLVKAVTADPDPSENCGLVRRPGAGLRGPITRVAFDVAA